MTQVIQLTREKYKDYPLVFEYETNEHFAVRSVKTAEGYSFQLVRERLPEPIKKRFVEHLFQHYLVDPEAYGIEEDGKLAAIIEIDREFWDGRLKITDLVVLPEYRRKGYGAMLVDKAKESAKAEAFRAIYLDTHSCNVPAIDFYLAQGFHFCGLDTTYYSNTDIERKEVMLQLVYPFTDPASMEWHYETHFARQHNGYEIED
jgi:ribosomal protein S18 acetylase RimI-like enzyme